MTRNVTVVFCVALLSVFCCFEAVAQQKSGMTSKRRSQQPQQQQQQQPQPQQQQQQPQQQSSSIWDDTSESNPYFRSGAKKTGADIRDENKKKEAQKTKFQRRTYTGPTKEEMEQAAKDKAVENFKNSLPLETKNMAVRFSEIDYNVAADTLMIDEFTLIPKEGKDPNVKYYVKAGSVKIRALNIGEYAGTPMTTSGEVTMRDVEVPMWNDKGTKCGHITFQQIKFYGDFLPVMKEMEGVLASVELTNFMSIKIINKIELNNIVRAKVFSAKSATFRNIKLEKNIVNSMKAQHLGGLEFGEAVVNGDVMPDMKAVTEAMTSYSARILDMDVVIGARLELGKENPKGSIQQLRENAEKNKKALEKLEKEKPVNNGI